MISESEDDLICDLAETYHIFDYRSVPVKLLATLSAGLRDDSRIKLRLHGEKCALNTMLQALTVDRLAILMHGLFNIDAEPELIINKIYGREEDDNAAHIMPDIFNSPEEFHARYSELTQNKET